MIQIKRALSTSLHFDPSKFTKVMMRDYQRRLVVSSPSSEAKQVKRSTEKNEGSHGRRWAELAKWVVSCFLESHKFRLLLVAFAPQIPADWLNGGFQACLDQWGRKSGGLSMWNCRGCLLSRWSGSLWATWDNNPVQMRLVGSLFKAFGSPADVNLFLCFGLGMWRQTKNTPILDLKKKQQFTEKYIYIHDVVLN